MNEVFRVYTSPDVLGMELGGSLKNVIALAAGMADGLGYGDNTKAALITRGIAEISVLAIEMGAKAETLFGLTGIGDLIVTCESRHSRNRKAGMLIGQGYTMDEATKEVKMVVEGIYSAKAALALAEKYDVRMPGFEAVKDFNLEVEDKEFIIFVGPSGCGKSTTLRMIAGLEEISSGELIIDGKVMNDVEPKDRDIAMVFQNYAFTHI